MWCLYYGKKKSEKEDKKIKEQTLEDAAKVAVTSDDEESDETKQETEETSEESTEESAPAEEAEEKPKKQKRVIKIRKSKKERENPLSIAIRLAVESGKVEYGSKAALKDALLGNAKAFIVATRAPSAIRKVWKTTVNYQILL